MNSIFKISNDRQQLINELIENGGELTPSLQLAFEITKDNFHTECEIGAYSLKEIEYKKYIIKEEINRFNQLLKSLEKAENTMRNNIETAMKLFEVDKIETPLIKISFRKSESVEVEDVNTLPALYKVVKVSESADKLKIKDAIKSGILIEGCSIKTNRNIQIK